MPRSFQVLLVGIICTVGTHTPCSAQEAVGAGIGEGFTDYGDVVPGPYDRGFMR